MIALTSLDYSTAAAKGATRLADLADIVIDNGIEPGDAIAALFLTHLLQNGSPEAALAHAAAAIYGLLKKTADARSREVLLIEAQDEFVRPTHSFQVETL